jgi:hypothetical protein
MLAPNVDDEVGLHLTAMVTARTVQESGSFRRMRLEHVLLEPGLLDESLVAARLGTNIVADFGVIALDVIEHCAPQTAGFTAVGADKFALLVLNIGYPVHPGCPCWLVDASSFRLCWSRHPQKNRVP